eukprot:3413173-Rhodomonas_salina.3
MVARWVLLRWRAAGEGVAAAGGLGPRKRAEGGEMSSGFEAEDAVACDADGASAHASSSDLEA